MEAACSGAAPRITRSSASSAKEAWGPCTRPKTRAFTIAGGLLLFASGLTLGQRTGTSRFAKYLQPLQIRGVDFVALEAMSTSFREQVPMDNDISIPSIWFNSKEDRMQASVLISPDHIESLREEDYNPV